MQAVPTTLARHNASLRFPTCNTTHAVHSCFGHLSGCVPELKQVARGWESAWAYCSAGIPQALKNTGAQFTKGHRFASSGSCVPSELFPRDLDRSELLSLLRHIMSRSFTYGELYSPMLEVATKGPRFAFAKLLIQVPQTSAVRSQIRRLTATAIEVSQWHGPSGKLLSISRKCFSQTLFTSILQSIPLDQCTFAMSIATSCCNSSLVFS